MAEEIVKFRLDGIEEVSLSLLTIPPRVINKLEHVDPAVPTVRYSLNFGLLINHDEDKVGVAIKIKGFYKDAESEDKVIDLMEFEGNVWFHVPSLDEILQKNDDETVLLPFKLLEALISPAYSTIRGVMYARISHTILRRFLLPMFVTKDAALALSKKPLFLVDKE